MHRGTEWDDNIKAEIAALKTFNHEFIIPFKGVIYEKAYVRIVMPLCDGSLSDLVHDLAGTVHPRRHVHILDSLLKQGLSALRYMDDLGYCHRDVKPCNFLYYEYDGQYTFQLSTSGSQIDVWGLFVTIAHVMGLINDAKLVFKSRDDITAAVVGAGARLPYLTDMARANCGETSSVADMISSLEGVHPRDIFQPIEGGSQHAELAVSQSGTLNLVNLWFELWLTNEGDIKTCVEIFKCIVLVAGEVLPATAGRRTNLAFDAMKVMMFSEGELLLSLKEGIEAGWAYVLKPIMQLAVELLPVIGRHIRGGVKKLKKWKVLLLLQAAKLVLKVYDRIEALCETLLLANNKDPNRALHRVCSQQPRPRLAVADA